MQHFGTSLSHFEFGFNTLIELFTSIPHLVYLETDPKDERTVTKVGLKLVNGSSSEKTHTMKSPDINNNSSSHMVISNNIIKNFFMKLEKFKLTLTILEINL